MTKEQLQLGDRLNRQILKLETTIADWKEMLTPSGYGTVRDPLVELIPDFAYLVNKHAKDE